MLDKVLVWFRRDLRDTDHVALDEALRRANRVFCVFIFDPDILRNFPSRTDRRVEFIRGSLIELDAALRQRGGGLIVRHARAEEEVPRLAGELGVSSVFFNRDYEPLAKLRDRLVSEALFLSGIGCESFKDQAVFDGQEVLTRSGRPFTIFTPYRKVWLERLAEEDWCSTTEHRGLLSKPLQSTGMPSLEDLGFAPSGLAESAVVPGMSGARECLEHFVGHLAEYQMKRDYPSVDGVSRLSVHLRFGTVSIRELVRYALEGGALRGSEGAFCWLSELVWREFYFMILDNFPRVVTGAFKPGHDALEWEQGETADEHFSAWCSARTGYPLVDAAMRQINRTGYMHNRLRMLVASFLTKDLGISWRLGEAYFAQRLIDFDLSANNGGWQWAASTGCDAQPYFRIFNPVRQSERFDPKGEFIRRFVPELSAVPDRFIHAPWLMPSALQSDCGVRIGSDYPLPLVEHEEARRKTLARFAALRRSCSG
jgi:deoxyribodipyrimidine photo-lyase